MQIPVFDTLLLHDGYYLRRGSTPVYILARASLMPLGASFDFKVHRSDFEVHQLPHVAFLKNFCRIKSTFLIFEI